MGNARVRFHCSARGIGCRKHTQQVQGKANPDGASQDATAVTPSGDRPAMATQSVLTLTQSQQLEAMHRTLFEGHRSSGYASYNISMNTIGFAIPRDAYPNWQRVISVKDLQISKGAHTTWHKHAQAGSTIIVVRLCMIKPTGLAALAAGNAVQSWAHMRNGECRYIQISTGPNSMDITGPRDLVHRYFGALLAGQSPDAGCLQGSPQPAEFCTWRENPPRFKKWAAYVLMSYSSPKIGLSYTVQRVLGHSIWRTYWLSSLRQQYLV